MLIYIMDVDGSIFGLFKELLPNLTGETKENHKKSAIRAESRTRDWTNAKQWQITTLTHPSYSKQTLTSQTATE